jgi:hypothetical protein
MSYIASLHSFALALIRARAWAAVVGKKWFLTAGMRKKRGSDDSAITSSV